MSSTAETTSPEDPEDLGAIFHHDGPVNPSFVHEAVRTLMRALPLEDPTEPQALADRRMQSAMLALAALHPRDEIEIMLAVQALSAYHAAAACWRIGMNLRRPHGDSTRHITTAASAARTFDSLLRALERRQAKPLAIPTSRPAPRIWNDTHPTRFMQTWQDRCRQDNDNQEGEPHPVPDPPVEWTPEAMALAGEMAERERIDSENEGLDIANTEGILPDGGIIMPRDPTPQQAAYVARRLGLAYKREYAENQRNGIKQYPKIRPIRTGDLIL